MSRSPLVDTTAEIPTQRWPGNFRRYLGQGSYGQVHAAADTHQDDRVVALKLLDPNQLDDWDWGEASLLTRLQSEYVLSIYNADAWDGVPYLATELATQGSLEHAEALPRLWVRDVLKADIWSLGATAYRLLTGVYPHEDISTGEMTLMAARCAVGPTRIRDLAPYVSRGVAASIEKALALSPADRHESMTAFDSSLSAQAVPKRVWREKMPDDGHLNCWESEAPNGLGVCKKKSGESGARVDLETTRSSGRRIRKHCSDGHYKRSASGRLKRIFDDLGT